MSIIFSDEHPVVVLAFRVRSRGSTWLDGSPVGRIYVEKRDIKRQVWELIEAGRLTLDPEGKKRPLLVSVRGSGGFYAAILENPEVAYRRHTLETRLPQPYMQPVTGYDEERYVIQLIEENRFYDFVELLKAYKPAGEEDLAVFGGGTSLLTAVKLTAEAQEEAAGSKGREARTLVLMDRGVSMAEPWSLWEQYPKIVVARFLANAVTASHPNMAVYSFGQTLRMEHSPNDVKPQDAETRLDEALTHVSLMKPERLVIITGGEGCENRENAARLLDSLSRLGVQTLLLSLDKHGERLTGRLADTPGVVVLPLTTGGDVVRMMHGIADLF